jgi:DNA-binding NarL/FixJ family response regulator
VDTEGTRHVAIAPATKPPIQWEVLRYRERQVLALAARGTSLKFIAAELGFTSVAALLRAYEANESRSER